MKQHFISCDWGTSSFRLRLINAGNKQVVAQIDHGRGIAGVYNEWLQAGLPDEKRVDFFKSVLQTQLNEWNSAQITGLPIIISGMASSSIGIMEIPYGDFPFNIALGELPTYRLKNSAGFSHDIVLVSGMKTEQDVMRGEETILLGCGITEGRQLFIFPGTHSKHVTVQDGIAVEIKTYMTGEIFDLLANKSILSKSVEKNDEEDLREYFEKGVEDSVGSNLLNAAFHVRTNQLFNKLTPKQNYHYLSGLVIGVELNGLEGSTSAVHFVCGKTLQHRYQHAADILCPGNHFQYSDADDALVNAHCQLWSLQNN
jgi:2-dehydro-3-deoxygalactonokinase